MWENKSDHKLEEYYRIETPCWNCGKPVLITVPFYGCIYCSDCSGGRSVAYKFKVIEEKEGKADGA